METTILGSARLPRSKTQAFLICGIVASVLWGLMVAIVPLLWEEYSSKTFTISELSAIGAPTRSLWVPLGIVYTLLMIVFGYGVYLSANGKRSLAVAGIALLINGAFSIYWPPMHLRGEGVTLTDTLHIVWSAITVALMVIVIISGAKAFGKSFRYYSIVTLIILMVFGMLTGLEAPGIPTNSPTPMIGIWERISVGVFYLWIVVFSVTLLRTMRTSASAS
ncbi:MAG TPA: DUF998 domain-containing protein [Chryseolinea sp.]